jgi:hypothetical protein
MSGLLAASSRPVIPFLFGIKATRLQWTSVVRGFYGVLVIINPGSESFSVWLLFPLASAFFFALYQMLTQLSGETDSASTCSFYVGIYCTAILSVAIPFFWVQLSAW